MIIYRCPVCHKLFTSKAWNTKSEKILGNKFDGSNYICLDEKCRSSFIEAHRISTITTDSWLEELTDEQFVAYIRNIAIGIVRDTAEFIRTELKEDGEKRRAMQKLAPFTVKMFDNDFFIDEYSEARMNEIKLFHKDIL